VKRIQITRTEAMAAWTVIWAPLAVVAMHAMLAAVLGHRRAFDPAFHVLGGAAGAYGLSQGLIPPLRTALKRQVVVVLVVCGVALLWELGEFVWDAIAGTHVQLGARDTLTDLALGASGAVLSAFVMLRYGR
jgi:hypothetical protein